MKSVGKISTGLLVILAGLAIVVVLTTCVGCSKVTPYNSHPKYASADEGFRPIHYASYPDGKSVDVKDRHLINSNASQPTAQRVSNLKGLFGRRVGAVEGYSYSDALRGRNFVWDKDTLFKLFDEGPDKFLPGTKMPVQRVTDREKLRQLLEYLETLTRLPN